MNKCIRLAAISFSFLFLSACDTGGDSEVVAEEIFVSLITGNYDGTFDNTPNTISGNVTLSLVEAEDQSVSGNIIFETIVGNCLSNTRVDGVLINSSLSLTADILSGSGPGSLAIELTVSPDGQTLDGTYVTAGEACSNATGSGSMRFNRA